MPKCETQHIHPIEYNSTLQGALVSVLGYLSQYSALTSQDDKPFIDSAWFRLGIKNTHPVTQHMLEITHAMCEDVVTHASALETTTTITVCLIGAAEVVMLAIGLFMLWTLQNNWKKLIKIMASLPHVALQHAISKYSVVQLIDDKVSKDEIKHWTLYDQMISARTVKKGIPMVKLVALFITNVVCAIVGVVTVTLIVTTKSKQLNVIPYRVYYAGEVMTNAFRCSSLLLRSLASANGISMCDDRIATLLTKIKDSRTSLIDSVNNFIAIEDNGYLSGVLSSTTSIVAMLFQTDRDWLDEKVESERLLVMPRLIALDVMSEQLTIAYQKHSYMALARDQDSSKRHILSAVHTLGAQQFG